MIDEPVVTNTKTDIGKIMAMLLVIASLLFALVGTVGNVAERYLSQAAIGQCVATVGDPVESLDKAP